MSQKALYLNTRFYKSSLASLLLMAAVSVQAAPTAPNADAANPIVAPINQPAVGDAATSSAPDINDTLAAQLQPSTKALSEANQELLSRNAQLQRQVNDLQTQANVLVYESKGQLFLYGAFTV
ncbi:MAG TPA: hypothetical protein DD294_06440, partial [Psychrobacter sp.]|nr:hypothetical protein [Psychrobacter sp.]